MSRRVLSLLVAGLALSGCARQVERRSVLPRSPLLHVDTSAVSLHAPAGQLETDLEVYRKQNVRPAAENPDRQPPAEELLPQSRIHASPAVLQNRSRSGHIREVLAGEERYLDSLRSEGLSTAQARIEADQRDREETNQERLAALERTINEKLLRDISQLPGRYAYPASTIDARLRIPQLRSERRTDLGSERDALQRTWRRELLDMWESSARELQQERQRLEASMKQEFDSERRRAESQVLDYFRPQRGRLSEDLYDSEKTWKVLSISTPLDEPPSGTFVLDRAPSPSATHASRRSRRRQLSENLRQAIQSTRDYTQAEARRQALTRAHEHHWERRAASPERASSKIQRPLQ